ncbi:MAG: peptidoglycan DD-metalloendopeptidase family protein [Sandaracinaceae bacterium]
MSRTYLALLLGAGLVLAPLSGASADPAERSTPARYDYSRFSDGPRNVPAPRGASRDRAEALGLGTREAASLAMRGRAPASWLRAAAWRDGDVDRLLWPVDDGRYVRGVGFVRRTRPGLRHDGVDIGAEPGSVVRAAADGIVVYSDNGIRGFGNCVILAHPNGWVTLYAHNTRTTVQPGWRVRRGERIALVGSTGISRGPHVHFQLHVEGHTVDPLALFDGGPAFVRRVAERAHARGDVPEPSAPSAEDRIEEAPLPTSSSSVATVATVPAADPSDPPLGSRALLRRLARFAPSSSLLARAGGRTFSDALWPARGGQLASSSQRGVRIDTDPDAAVRAADDGLVVYASERGRHGFEIVIVHPMGWVTRYRGVREPNVEVGQSVERGAWIARSNGRFELALRVDGHLVDPRPHLRGIPHD